jgi:porin
MTSILLSVLAALTLQAPPPPPPAMTDDLGGVRSTLADAGVTFVLAYTHEVMSNVHGGLERETSADLLLDWVIDADLNKAVGWTGASARVNPMWLAGTGISDDIGDLTRVSNIAGEGAVRVFEAWLQQALFDGAFSLRAGILAMDQEFVLTAAGTLYFNSVFGGPVFTTPNVPTPIYPIGSPGARARVDFSKSVYLQAAVYDGDPGSEAFNRSGFQQRLHDEDGLFTIVESGILLGTTHATVIKAGGFLHTDEFIEHTTGIAHEGLLGGYLVLEQKVVPGTVDAFIRLGVAQENRALVSFGFDSGINFTGLIPGRPADVLGIGLVYARISRDFAKTQPDRERWGHETVLEVTYKITLTPWLMVQPDLQYIVHPGGSTAIPNAVVLGIRLDLLF